MEIGYFAMPSHPPECGLKEGHDWDLQVLRWLDELGYQVPFAQAIREATGVNTIAVGLITEAKQAEDIVASGKADMVALARAMLYDPRWGWHAAAELGGHVEAPPQYWRSQPSTQKALFGETRFGAR